MHFSVTLLTFMDIFLMAYCLPVFTYRGNIVPTENSYYIYPIETENTYEEQKTAAARGANLLQVKAGKKYSTSPFLTNMLPPSLLVPLFMPKVVHHASKRGGRVLNKRTRKYTRCLINMGLGHNCDYREAIGAAHEAQHWYSVG